MRIKRTNCIGYCRLERTKEQVKHNERSIKMDGLGEPKKHDQKKHPGSMHAGRGLYGEVHPLPLAVRDGAVTIAALPISKAEYSKLLLEE